jgi:hypothetical protein
MAFLVAIIVKFYESVSVFGTAAEMCRDRDGNVRRWRWRYVSRYYFISMTSTIYSKLVLIVKERDMSILSTQTGLVKSGAV